MAVAAAVRHRAPSRLAREQDHARKCWSEFTEVSCQGPGTLWVSRSGYFDVNVPPNPPPDAGYPLDRIIAHPDAYVDSGACQPGQPMSCQYTLHDEGPGWNYGGAMDEALFHFHVDPGQPTPSDLGIVPIPIITSLSDSGKTSCTPGATTLPFSSTASDGAAVHACIDETIDFGAGANTQAWPVGRGNGDAMDGSADPGHTERRTGPMIFENLGPHWDQWCGFLNDCNGIEKSQYCSNLGGVTGQVNVVNVHMQRILDSDGKYGADIDSGDSGGPLLIQGGPSPGLPELTADEWFVFGISSHTTGGDPADPSAQVDQTFPPTWSPANGPWIETTVRALLTDTDGDGVLNDADNCWTVRNWNQQDSNWDAELELVLTSASPCSDYAWSGQGTGACPTWEGYPPGTGGAPDTPDYVAHFRANYPGDACDSNATTASAASTVPNPTGATAPCQVCVTVQTCTGTSTTCGPSHLPSQQACPTFVNTGLNMTSYIGNLSGDAPSAQGMSAPAFCRCDAAPSDPNWHRHCEQQASPCTIARDSLFQPGPSSVLGDPQQQCGRSSGH